MQLLLERKAMTNLDSILKSWDITLLTNVHIVKAMVFPVVLAQMWELDHKEGWVPKNWSFWTVMLEKTLESHLDSKEIKPVILKEINPDYSLEALMLQLQWFATWWEELTHWKRAWCWERLKAKGQAEDVIVKWHHQISGYEFEQTPGGREGQGSLAYCSPWRHKELDTT